MLTADLWFCCGDPSKLEVSWENDENLSPVFSHDEVMMVAGL
jgi:hypothetical protein